jgi:hypothetical protein
VERRRQQLAELPELLAFRRGKLRIVRQATNQISAPQGDRMLSTPTCRHQ